MVLHFSYPSCSYTLISNYCYYLQDTLLPYVTSKVESFLNANYDKDEVKEVITKLRETETEILKEGEQKEVVESLIKVVKDLTEKNSELEAFKTLQGLIYKAGYEAGDLKGQ